MVDSARQQRITEGKELAERANVLTVLAATTAIFLVFWVNL